MTDLQTREQMLADIAPRSADMKAKPYMTDTSKIEELLERLEKFNTEWRRMPSACDEIYGLHFGTDREALIRASDIDEVLITIRALLEREAKLRDAVKRSQRRLNPLPDDTAADNKRDKNLAYAILCQAALQETDNAG